MVHRIDEDESLVSSAIDFFLIGKTTTIQSVGAESWSKNRDSQNTASSDQSWATVGGLDGAIKELMETVEQVQRGLLFCGKKESL